jgi:hypothetical protein
MPGAAAEQRRGDEHEPPVHDPRPRGAIGPLGGEVEGARERRAVEAEGGEALGSGGAVERVGQGALRADGPW